jgi:hypothetical protein
MADRLSLEYSALGAISQRLYSTILTGLPELLAYASMMKSGEPDGFSISIVVPSPTRDETRSFEIWVDEVATPSIGFGPSHTHESADENGIATVIERARAILHDQLLIIEDIGGDYPGFSAWIDLGIPDALEEELTSQYSSGHALLKSWSGKGDRQLSIKEL